jgi:hypothetical protein
MGWSSGPSISCEYERYGVRYPIGCPRSNLYIYLYDAILKTLKLEENFPNRCSSFEVEMTWIPIRCPRSNLLYNAILKTLKLCEEVFPNRCSSFEVEMAQILQDAKRTATLL